MLKEILIGLIVMLVGALVTGIATGVSMLVRLGIRLAIAEEKQKYQSGQIRQLLRRVGVLKDGPSETSGGD